MRFVRPRVCHHVGNSQQRGGPTAMMAQAEATQKQAVAQTGAQDKEDAPKDAAQTSDNTTSDDAGEGDSKEELVRCPYPCVASGGVADPCIATASASFLRVLCLRKL